MHGCATDEDRLYNRTPIPAALPDYLQTDVSQGVLMACSTGMHRRGPPRIMRSVNIL
jgi:hypothetical protein